MNPLVRPFSVLYDLNYDLLLNCLEGISDTDAQKRLSGVGNSITFLAAHITDSRYFLLSRLGPAEPNPLADYLENARSIEEIRRWPSLEEIRRAWLAVSNALEPVLDGLSDPQLAEPNVHRFPSGDSTRLGLMAFLLQHESYHLGQVAFLRRQLGHPPMSYTRKNSSRAGGRLEPTG